MELSEVINLPAGTILTYKKYDTNRLGQKTLLQHLERHTLERVLTPTDKLDITKLHEYYGIGLTSQDYMQLSQINTYRLVLYVLDGDGNKYYTVANVDQYFLSMGLIQVETANAAPSTIFGLGQYGTKVNFENE